MITHIEGLLYDLSQLKAQVSGVWKEEKKKLAVVLMY